MQNIIVVEDGVLVWPVSIGTEESTGTPAYRILHVDLDEPGRVDVVPIPTGMPGLTGFDTSGQSGAPYTYLSTTEGKTVDHNGDPTPFDMYGGLGLNTSGFQGTGFLNILQGPPTPASDVSSVGGTFSFRTVAAADNSRAYAATGAPYGLEPNQWGDPPGVVELSGGYYAVVIDVLRPYSVYETAIILYKSLSDAANHYNPLKVGAYTIGSAYIGPRLDVATGTTTRWTSYRKTNES